MLYYLFLVIPLIRGSQNLFGGPVEGALCDVESVQKANSLQLHSILEELTNLTYFRLVRVDMSAGCQFNFGGDVASATCGGGDLGRAPGGMGLGEEVSHAGGSCSISPEVGEVPRQLHLEKVDLSKSASDISAEEEFDDLDEDCDEELDLRPDFWLDMCGDETLDADYVNILLNPERNTGYNGSHVWQAIYAENCLKIGGGDAHTLDESPERHRFVCHEERVLYRLLSGLHTSTTISVVENYFPPKNGETKWRPNPEKFMEKVAAHPERVRNLHFTFVVMLRALFKAKPFLYTWDYSAGNHEETEHTLSTVRRLVDSSAMWLCGPVFSAFDETTMFARHGMSERERGALAHQFKEVFQNVTSLVDCVSCQRCRLHAKLSLQGIGVALKILLTDDSRLLMNALSRDEIVAFVNTIAKFSHSLASLEEIAELYAEKQEAILAKAAAQGVGNLLVQKDVALQHIASLPAGVQQDQLSLRVLSGDESLLLLSKHFGHSREMFLHQASRYAGLLEYDLIVVGGGLAGMAAALAAGDRGAAVLLIDKQNFLGGNSAKASSGINARQGEDDYEVFLEDTLKSSGGAGNPILSRVLVEESEGTVEWLSSRVGLKLPFKARLGGHSFPRTLRPAEGIIGAEVTRAASKAIRELKNVDVLLNSKVKNLVQQDGKVVGVEVEGDGIEQARPFFGRNVLLASGGFGFDRDLHNSFLREYQPELVEFPTTLGSHTTGDGIRMGVEVGGALIDMEHVQLHPTGFVDPVDPSAHTKVLAAEVLRGVGGLLLDQKGERFCDELGTRRYVTERMIENSGKTGEFWIVLTDKMKDKAEKHVNLYMLKKLMKRMTWDEVQDSIGGKIEFELRALESSLQAGVDRFGKKFFEGVPVDFSGSFYVGKVQPVIHYTMGGLLINTEGQVIKKGSEEEGGEEVVPGLYAAGEVAGGVHGRNRLGGNSLSECAVFGRKVGMGVSIKPRPLLDAPWGGVKEGGGSALPAQESRRELEGVGLESLREHGVEDNCWVAIDDLVYDFSNYADDHPGGRASILESCGKDATSKFFAVHTRELLQDMEFYPIARLLDVDRKGGEQVAKSSGREEL